MGEHSNQLASKYKNIDSYMNEPA